MPALRSGGSLALHPAHGRSLGRALSIGVSVLGLALSSGVARAQPAFVGYLDSSTLPIRVHYPTEASATTAATVLAEAEQAWEAEVVVMGFAQPMTEDASGNASPGLWIYLVEGAEYAHAEPVSDLPSTPWTDCTTRVLLPADLPESYIPLYVTHECHHAMEMAVDCVEAPFAYENTTVAVTVLLFPQDSLWLTYFLPGFQAFPHLGVDCTFFMDQTRRYYHYGAALFQVFLDAWVGDGDGRLFPRFWQAARQEGTVTVAGGAAYSSSPNEPDLLDGIALVLEEEGTTLHEAFAEFALWRFFVGADDDGEHFEHGGLWTGGELRVDTSHVVNDLPLGGAEPVTLPQDYGTTYIELDTSGIEPPMGVVFSFEGTSDATWHVGALRVAADGSVDVEPVPLFEAGQGEARHGTLGGIDRLVWAVSALGGQEHDANRPDCSGGHSLTYSLRLEDTDTVPSITAIEPSQLTPGQSHGLNVTGTGFVPGITAAVEGGGVGVFSVEHSSDTSLHVVVTVADETAEGPRTLVLANPNGHQARAEDGLSVVIEKSPRSGCGCQGASADPGIGIGRPGSDRTGSGRMGSGQPGSGLDGDPKAPLGFLLLSGIVLGFLSLRTRRARCTRRARR